MQQHSTAPETQDVLSVVYSILKPFIHFFIEALFNLIRMMTNENIYR